MPRKQTPRRLFTADFETTTDENDCRVWAWAVCEVGNPDFFTYGNTIDSFFEFMEKSGNSSFWFHNLKFDSEFIFVELFKRGFHHVTDEKEEKSKTFSTLISDKGQFYSVKIIFDKKNKKTNYVKIFDSLKLLPFSVKEVAKGFDLPISKLNLNYTDFREYGHILTPHEVDYIRNDVDIVARALHTMFEQQLTKMTTAGNALHNYKSIVGENNFKRWFHILYCDPDIRRTYRGGFTYMNPLYHEKDIGEGIVLDVNSLYPWAMYNCPLPHGEPLFFEGEYQPDPLYPLYTQRIACSFELKEGHIPTIQMKGWEGFIPTEYITSSGDEEVILDLTSVDLELFKEHYHIYNPVYINGWKFKATTVLFKDYIDYWMRVKVEASRTKNKPMRTLAKLMLNSLYGKFGKNPKMKSKIPYLNDGKISYTEGDEEIGDPIYIPVASFITAWARHKTITSAQKVYPIFAYADTDSLHLNLKLPEGMRNMTDEELEELTTKDLIKYGLDIPEDFKVHPDELGAWKIETRFHRARFIRAKTYIEDLNPPETWGNLEYNSVDVIQICEDLEIPEDDGLKNYQHYHYYDRSKLKITCAGMPSNCYEFVTWENFHEGSSYKGKLIPKHVPGGIVLQETDFTIKETATAYERMKEKIRKALKQS